MKVYRDPADTPASGKITGTSIYENENEKLILWNKLGNTEEVEKSELGTDMTITGTLTHSDVKFNNGYNDGGAGGAANYLSFADPSIFYRDRGCIEFWSKYDQGMAIVNGDPTVWSQPHVFNCHVNPTGSSGYIAMLHRDAPSYTYLQIYNGSQSITAINSSCNIAIDNIVHWALVYDLDGIDGTTDKLRLYYYNETSGENSITSATGTFSGWPIEFNNARFGRCAGQSDNWRPHMSIDNVKVCNYAKTDFSDRFNEYPSEINGTNIKTDPTKKLILWNKLGSTSEVENSEIGKNLVEGSAVTYSVGNFDNGFEVGASTTLGVATMNLPAGSLTNVEKITFEFLYKHTSSFTGSYPGWLISSSLSNVYMFINFRMSNSNIIFAVAKTPSIADQYEWDLINLATADAFFDLGGDFHHYAFTYDYSLGTQLRCKFYKDNVSQGLPDVTYELGTMTPGLTQSNDQHFGSGWTAGDGMHGIMDNLKIHNYTKSDFSDRLIQEPIDISKIVI